MFTKRVGRRIVAPVVAGAVVGAVALASGPAVATTSATAPRTVTIAVDLPLQGTVASASSDTLRAMQLYLGQVGNRAGRYRVKLRAYDNSTAGSGTWNGATCAANAKRHVAAKDEVLVIGPYNSGCAKLMIPVLNRDRTGPLVMISHGAANPGLTIPWERGEPKKYYPSGKRNFARVVPRDDVQAVAGAKYAAATLHTRRAFVLDDGTSYGHGVATVFATAAPKSKIKVVGKATWAPTAANYTALFQKIKATKPDTIYIGGVFVSNVGRLLQDKVAILGDNDTVKVLASDGLTGYPELNALGEGQGVFATYAGVDSEVLYSRANGKRFMEAYKAKYGSYPSSTFALYGVAALQEGLAALSRSDGTRKGVQKVLFSGRGVSVPSSASVLGTGFGIDPKTGDVTVREVTVERIINGAEQRVGVITIK